MTNHVSVISLFAAERKERLEVKHSWKTYGAFLHSFLPKAKVFNESKTEWVDTQFLAYFIRSV